MDISKEYILQCEKTEEIQKKFIGIEGSFVADKWGNTISLLIHSPAIGNYVLRRTDNQELYDNQKDKLIWLPRQDQLQEMMKFSDVRQEMEYFYGFCAGWSTSEMPYKSLEQLWLAFVMSEKYQKRWNKEKEEWTQNP